MAEAIATSYQPAAHELRGLTSAEAQQRALAGLANVDTSRVRTTGDVIRANTLNFFNIVLLSMIAALLAVAEFRDAFFIAVVVFANIAVSTYQEARAVKTLNQLVALTAPHATVVRDGKQVQVLASEVVQGDLLHLRPGDQVVADGRIVADHCEIDESLLTGESDSIKKGPGDELRSGSFCTAGEAYYTADAVGMDSYAMRLTAEARQLVKRLTPLQVRFQRILRVLLIGTGILAALLMISYNVEDRGFTESIRATTATVTTIVPAGLLLGLTVAFAVGAVRVSRSGAIVQEINTVEALNYTDVICLDKTGTITANRLSLEEQHWLDEAGWARPWLAALVSASREESKTAGALAEALAAGSNGARPTGSVPFNSARRWSAMQLTAGGETRCFVLGAPETVLGEAGHDQLTPRYEEAAERGMRGVIFAEVDALPDPDQPLGSVRPLALLVLGDVLRPEVRQAFAMMESLGIEPKLISGDNPHTVAALLKQLGITTKGGLISGPELDGLDEVAFKRAVAEHTVFGRIAPAQKARIVATLREQGHFVAMVGDGANDVQALRAADVAVAMASGTSTARAVAGIVLLQDSFTALIRGAKEATAVLGNSARLTKLFLAKSLYAYWLIVATNMLGLDFPFLPRQGSVTALLTLGIPAIFISISVPPPDSGRDFTRNVLRFALPASVAVAAAAVSVHLLVQGVLNRDINEARTLVSLTLGIVGLFFVVEVLGFEGASFRSLTRPVMTTVLAALLFLGMLATVYVEPLRDFFDFTPVDPLEWTIIGVAVVGALAAQFAFTKYWQEIFDFLLGRRGADEALRGRAV